MGTTLSEVYTCAPPSAFLVTVVCCQCANIHCKSISYCSYYYSCLLLHEPRPYIQEAALRIAFRPSVRPSVRLSRVCTLTQERKDLEIPKLVGRWLVSQLTDGADMGQGQGHEVNLCIPGKCSRTANGQAAICSWDLSSLVC